MEYNLRYNIILIKTKTDKVIKIEINILYIFIYSMSLTRALACRALACRALPSRAVALISEYSKPLTRPDWRTLRRLSIHMLYEELIDMRYDGANVTKRLLILILRNVTNTEWFFMYNTIRNNGLDTYYMLYFYKYGVNYENTINIRDIDGIQFAIQSHLTTLTIKTIPNYKNLKGIKKMNSND